MEFFINNMAGSLALLIIALWGFPYIGLGALQYHIYSKKATEKQISEFLKSLRPPISILYMGAKGHVVFSITLANSNRTLYQDMIQFSKLTGFRLAYNIVIPFLVGFLFLALPIYIFGGSAILGTGSIRLFGILGMLILALGIMQAFKFGQKM